MSAPDVEAGVLAAARRFARAQRTHERAKADAAGSHTPAHRAAANEALQKAYTALDAARTALHAAARALPDP